MKLLLDTCVWGGSKAALEALGHDAVWGGDWTDDPGDEQILAMAHREGRVLITLDKDFGELAILRNLPHHGILRIVDFPARQQAVSGRADTARSGTGSGAIITAEPGRLRIRPPGN